MTQAQTQDVVQLTLEAICEAIVSEERLELRNFGVFEVKQRQARMAQNPKTLEPVKVPPKRTVKFKVGRLMKQTLANPAAAARGFCQRADYNPSGDSDGRCFFIVGLAGI